MHLNFDLLAAGGDLLEWDPEQSLVVFTDTHIPVEFIMGFQAARLTRSLTSDLAALLPALTEAQAALAAYLNDLQFGPDWDTALDSAGVPLIWTRIDPSH
jgi:hypothetical protein